MDKDTQSKIFWHRLKELRKNKRPGGKLSQKAVASDLGISYDNYRKYETSIVPSIDILSNLADYFGVSVDYLIGRVDSPNAGDEPKINFVLSSPESEYKTQKNDVGDVSELEELTDLEIMAIRKLRKISLDDKIDAINYIMNKDNVV